MQQFGASAFYTVVRWHKLGEVDIESTSLNFIVLTIRWVIFSHPVQSGPKNGTKFIAP